MFSEEDFLPLSALQHLCFCERQCALIHVEQQWFENRYTAEGKVMHGRVDMDGEKKIGGVRIEYGLRLVCHELGLVGQADVVEFHSVDGESGKWVPYPVEYKRGKPKMDNSDRVQLCAQALCLEEMYRRSIPEGALFYRKVRRRQKVFFSDGLRQETVEKARKLHSLIRDKITPEPVYEKKCERCSFVDFCMPKICKKKSVKNYMEQMMK